ncbi:MAG: hypothetical protein V3S11_02390, partial [Elusimicrobiota bacterium]
SEEIQTESRDLFTRSERSLTAKLEALSNSQTAYRESVATFAGNYVTLQTELAQLGRSTAGGDAPMRTMRGNARGITTAIDSSARAMDSWGGEFDSRVRGLVNGTAGWFESFKGDGSFRPN